jgi:hypothetical protein
MVIPWQVLFAGTPHIIRRVLVSTSYVTGSEEDHSWLGLMTYSNYKMLSVPYFMPHDPEERTNKKILLWVKVASSGPQVADYIKYFEKIICTSKEQMVYINALSMVSNNKKNREMQNQLLQMIATMIRQGAAVHTSSLILYLYLTLNKHSNYMGQFTYYSIIVCRTSWEQGFWWPN